MQIRRKADKKRINLSLSALWINALGVFTYFGGKHQICTACIPVFYSFV